MDNSFEFNGKKYQYFEHKYNHPRTNERRVEIPIAKKFLDDQERKPRKPIIEVGNVLYHYFKCHHDVLDLYERQKGVRIIHEDVLTFEPKKKYQVAISISTVEHTKNPILAIDRIISLAPKVLITFPIGKFYIKELVKKYNFNFMVRMDADNNWEQCTYNVVANYKYGEPFKWANAIAILIQK